MRYPATILAAMLSIATCGLALAQADVVMAPDRGEPVLLDEYVAFIGDDDLFNSGGDRLSDPAAILRQDRANFHLYGIKQRGDQGDGFFDSKTNRAALENMLASGRMSRQASRSIVRGGGLVRVEIWGRGSTGDYVRVEVR